MPAAVFNLNFEQGIGREVVVSSWKNNRTGKFYDLAGFTGHLSVRAKLGDDVLLFDKTTENEGIVIRTAYSTDPASGITTVTGNQIITYFSDADAQTMVPIPGLRPERTCEGEAPLFKFGVYELRIFAASGRTVSVARGDTFVTPGVVKV